MFCFGTVFSQPFLPSLTRLSSPSLATTASCWCQRVSVLVSAMGCEARWVCRIDQLSIQKPRPGLLPATCNRFVVCSDAAWIPSDRVPSTQTAKQSLSMSTNRSTPLFPPGNIKIAQLELSIVLFARSTRAHTFHGGKGVWFISNFAARRHL